MFELETTQLNDVLNCLSYTFEQVSSINFYICLKYELTLLQSAFTSTGPEDLNTVLVDAGFDHDHAQVLYIFLIASNSCIR